MRCSLLRLWLGTSLMTTLLTCGCQHGRQCCSSCAGSTCGGNAAASAPIVSRSTSYAPSVTTPSASQEFFAPLATGTPLVHTTAKPATSADATADRSALGDGLNAANGRPATEPFRDATASRRTFTDLTAHPRFAHDPNYHWLVGVLDYSKIQGEWLLRYASVEEDDRYGGSVTLHRPGPMNQFKSGQLVRVEGHVINPESQQLRPAFEVQSLRPAER